MWLDLAEVKYLAVSEEEHDAGFHHVLENEVFIVVTALVDVAHHQIINSRLPLGSQFVRLCVVVDFFLRDFSVKNFLVHACSEIRGDSTFGVLNQERLVVFGQQSLTDQYALIYERLLLIHADLSHLDVKFDKAATDALEGGRLELELDCSPGQVLVVRDVH